MPRPASIRLYGPHAAAIATIMGSLLAAILLVWLNYKALGRPDLARKMGWIGIGVQVLLLMVFSMLPPSQLVMFGLPLVQVAIAYWGVVYLQGKAIAWHLANGGSLHTPWRAAGMGLAVGFVVLFAAVIAITVLIASGVIAVPETVPPAGT